MKKLILAIGLSLCILSYNSISAYSAPVSETIETNEIPNWPKGPELNAQAAYLLEANTGVVLYSKNSNAHLYPASTTKMMTALLAAENCETDEIVSFSHDAVFSLEAGSSSIGIDPGESMPMEECLYGIMVGSANEVANAIGEHISGSMEAFVDLMNSRASELGCADTHFCNTNGLHDDNHYTSAHDLAVIAREFFNNDKLSTVGNTATHHFVATASQPDDFYVKNKHKLINGEIPYPGIKGGKTGYTAAANETLVTCAEQNGMRLICVILGEDSPEQFNDTVKLFDYGFSNFAPANISANETRYAIKSTNFFPTNYDILGNSDQLLTLNKDNYIIMPANLSFDKLESVVSYSTESPSEVVQITYSYHGAYLGYGVVNRASETPEVSVFDSSLTTSSEKIAENGQKPVFINVIFVGTIVVGIALIGIIVSLVVSVFTNYNILDNLRSDKRERRRRRSRKRGDFHF